VEDYRPPHQSKPEDRLEFVVPPVPVDRIKGGVIRLGNTNTSVNSLKSIPHELLLEIKTSWST